MDFTADIASPVIFRQWSAIAAVAGAMERKCWVRTRQGAIFPNLFTMFIAEPGVGKTESIKITEGLWRTTKLLHVAPKRLTVASLIDNLKEALQVKVGGPGKPDYEFHSLQIPLTEFGSFLSSHDLDMLSTLNDLYDNPGEFSERRRHVHEGKEMTIVAPQINILAGTQPQFMSKILPEEAWGMGFTSRIVMVYASADYPKGSLWGENTARDPLKLVNMLTNCASRYGQFQWSDEAKHRMDVWWQGGLKPVPDHSKLANYLPRRILHVMKLCMVSGMSAHGECRIEEDDVTRAQDWLLTAEADMPNIFRAMVQRSDTDIINELHLAMWRVWSTNQKKPVHKSMLWNFLQARTTVDKIARVVEIAENAKFIQRVPGSNEHWIPLPKQMHGVE